MTLLSVHAVILITILSTKAIVSGPCRGVSTTRLPRTGTLRARGSRAAFALAAGTLHV
jgi:hypothetical protein